METSSRTRDYWLMPTRVATGDIEWPEDERSRPQPLPPHGVEHYYALLGAVGRLQETVQVENVRCEFWPLFFCNVQAASQTGTNAIRPAFLHAKFESGIAADAPATPARTKKRPVKKPPGTPP